MEIDLRPEDSWEEINEVVNRQLDVPPGVQGFVYKGLGHGLLECTQGLVRQFPHKRKVIYIKNLDPAVYPAMAQLATEGLDVQAVSADVFENQQSLAELLGGDTLFVLFSLDAPLTGQTYPIEKLLETIGDQRIYRIGVSHFSHYYNPISEFSRYDVRLLSLINGELCLSLQGERAKFKAPLARVLKWEREKILEAIERVSAGKESRERIEKLESEAPGGLTPFFQGDNRIWDRAVFYWEDMDGHAFVDELAKELKISLGQPGEKTLLETASLSRWGGVRTMDWLGAQGIGPNVIRGLVAIDACLINNELSAKIELVRHRILSWQNGD